MASEELIIAVQICLHVDPPKHLADNFNSLNIRTNNAMGLDNLRQSSP